MSSDEDFVTANKAIEIAVIAIGLIGNVLSIIVFSRKSFGLNSISLYYIGVAMSEIFNATQFILDIYYTLEYDVYLQDQSTYLSNFLYSMPTFLTAIQPLVLIAYSIDKNPAIQMLLDKKWFEWVVGAAIIPTNIALYNYYQSYSEKFPSSDHKAIRYFKVMTITNLLEACFLSVLIRAIASIYNTIKPRNTVFQVSKVSQEKKSSDDGSKDEEETSLTFYIMFAILKMPSVFILILSVYFNIYNLVYFKIGIFLYFLNASSNFFINMATYSQFRREFLVLFRLEKRKSETIDRTKFQTSLNQKSSTH